MLLKFVIDPATFLDKRYLLDASDMVARLKDLEKFWVNHGIWVKPKDDALHGFFEAHSNEFTNKVKHRFQEMFFDEEPLYRQYYVDGDVPFEQIATGSDLERYAVETGFDMALLEPVRAQEIGLAQGDVCACAQLPFPELTCLHLVESTCQVDAIQKLSGKKIDPYDDPAEIWRARLQPYAEYAHSGEVVIIDPYCTRHLWDDANRNEGLSNLLRYLFALEGVSKGPNRNRLNITIYGSYDQSYGASFDDSLARIREAFDAILNRIHRPSSRVKGVHAYLLPSPDPQKMLHDRYIRIDDNLFTLGEGLVIFNHVHSPRRPNGPRDFQLKPFHEIGSSHEFEKDLRKQCKGEELYRWKPN